MTFWWCWPDSKKKKVPVACGRGIFGTRVGIWAGHVSVAGSGTLAQSQRGGKR